MYKKYLLITLTFIFQIFFFQSTSAYLPPSVVINNELEQCSWFGGSADKEYLLPDGWSYLNESCDMNCCSKLGYEIVDLEFKDKRSPYGSALLFYRIILFIILGAIILSSFKKIEKNKTIFAKFMIILFFLSLSLYMATLLLKIFNSL